MKEEKKSLPLTVVRIEGEKCSLPLKVVRTEDEIRRMIAATKGSVHRRGR